MNGLELISIEQAAAQGIERLRKPIWANQFDHIKIDIHGGKPGIWMHLYCPFNQECNGRDPVDQLILLCVPDTYEAEEFVPYTGPLPDSQEYKTEVAKFEGCLK